MMKSLMIKITEDDGEFAVDVEIQEYTTTEVIGVLEVLKQEYVKEFLGNEMNFNVN